ncbi:hypothetical protein Tsubulata_008859 [Turnera subulata]|uniref:Uncharacterized protein n=1 Tax=Turnera subulata TaxID=218843 RepID=A0A9Q0J0U2_9ROSI|nr:hypothetical protein Tsubulata_008859 [Turnera subulata]
MSIEALAMAGVDYAECRIDLELWENQELEQPPQHLIADQQSPGVEKERKNKDGQLCEAHGLHWDRQGVSTFNRKAAV